MIGKKEIYNIVCHKEMPRLPTASYDWLPENEKSLYKIVTTTTTKYDLKYLSFSAEV
jgi:hypothetical protein